MRLEFIKQNRILNVSLSFFCLLILSCGGENINLNNSNTFNCFAHKTGTYIIEDGSKDEYWVTRTDSNETEYFKAFDGYETKVTSEIKWVSECEYIAFNEQVILGNKGTGDTLLVTLSDITEKGYTRKVTVYNEAPSSAKAVLKRLIKLP